MEELKFNDIFSNRLKYYLNINNMTQIELAKKIGVGTTSVSNWCKGLKTPRMDKVDAMCQIFNCRRTDLMEIPSDSHPEPLHPGSVSGDSAAFSQRPLSDAASALLDNFDRLNDFGKDKALDYVADLAEQDKYTQDTGHSGSAAG